MRLIGDAYRELNAELHRLRPDYGSHSSRHAETIVQMMTEGACETALDYGCGKARLSNALAGVDVANYDPAIPEYSAPPEPADLVICTDVLEHIEPDCLDAVLADLNRLARKLLFFVIACRPASQTLPDGSNTHKIIETPEWWRARLSEHFEIREWNSKPHEVAGIATPLRELTADSIKHTVAVADAERNAQVAINCARLAARVTEEGQPVLRPLNGRRAVLACYGPSLRSSWPSIALQAADPNVDVFSVSAAHKFLIERGVVPYAHIDCDPRIHKLQQIGEPHRDVKYLLASCVHPDWLDKLEGYDVALWHAYNGAASVAGLKAIPSELQQQMVIGGGSVGIRAMSVIHYLGYRDLQVHGMDCSYADGEAYAGEHLGKAKPKIRVKCRDRWFDTSPVFVLYARYFRKTLELLKDCEISFCGDGLLQTMYRPGAAALDA